uniref:Ribosomal RNA-processing protein 43 n=1 Tax=Callorhinchus milii TaxID=7868 RepID=V9L3G1_CALMI
MSFALLFLGVHLRFHFQKYFSVTVKLSCLSAKGSVANLTAERFKFVIFFYVKKFSSQFLQKEDLCIEKGKLVWVVYCDMMCLDYDGNLLDACIIALLAALKNVQLPSVSISVETGLAEVDMNQKNQLNIRKHPVATSFAIFDDTIFIVDPTAEEETLASGMATIVVDEEDRLCAVHKPGGSGASGEKLQDCIVRAQTRHREVYKLLSEVMKSVTPSTDGKQEAPKKASLYK